MTDLIFCAALLALGLAASLLVRPTLRRETRRWRRSHGGLVFDTGTLQLYRSIYIPADQIYVMPNVTMPVVLDATISNMVIDFDAQRARLLFEQRMLLREVQRPGGLVHITNVT